jgi:hypothetical protein
LPRVPAYSDFSEARVKHLEFVQGVITRLGTNSFLIKGWAVTVSGAFVGFAITEKKWELALASFLPTILFWGIDAYFLRVERLFRHLYDEVRTENVEPFSMDIRRHYDKPNVEWANVVFSWTLVVFYGLLVVSGAAAIIVLGC